MCKYTETTTYEVRYTVTITARETGTEVERVRGCKRFDNEPYAANTAYSEFTRRCNEYQGLIISGGVSTIREYSVEMLVSDGDNRISLVYQADSTED